METIFKHQDKILRILNGKTAPFYLAGGTALAKFYFQHRESYDLDFFSQTFSAAKIKDLVGLIEKGTHKKTKLIRKEQKEGFAQILTYEVILEKKEALKIDFVEDVLPLMGPLKRVDGIDILSLDDIYLRKIYAISGTLAETDQVGQKRFLGGRQEAKDFYDLYQLSSTHQPLSRFALKHCDDLQREALVRWFHTYSRPEIKMGLTELKTQKPIEFVVIEKHFKREIDELIGGMV